LAGKIHKINNFRDDLILFTKSSKLFQIQLNFRTRVGIQSNNTRFISAISSQTTTRVEKRISQGWKRCEEVVADSCELI
jgi:hypothetical protein